MSRETIRFGDFELDSNSFELRRAGHIVKLERIPLQLLFLLAENHARFVPREEIRQAIWGNDVFVDADNSINTAVRKARQALKDDPDNPRFLRTIPGKGYRFTAQVTVSTPSATADGSKPPEPAPEANGDSADNPAFNQTSARLEIPIGQNGKMRGPAVRPETPRRKHLSKRAWAVAAASVVSLVCAALWYSQPRPPTVTNAARITNDRKAKSPLNPPVTDGVRLYFIEGMPWTTGSGIAQLSATGGETTWIATTLPEVLAIYDISPDRSALLVANGVAVGSDLATELWVQPLPAGAPHRVGNIDASSACWTPNGTHIVYSDGPAIMTANDDGGEPHQLAKVPGVARAFRFSPDGRRIRFYVTQAKADSNSIWEMDANGENLHPLFPDWKESPYQCCGNWSPDGDYYYFQAGRGNTQAIWVMPEVRSIFRRGASTPSRLTSGPLRFSSPVPSSDGKKLFVVGEEPRVELFRYDLQARRFDPYLPGFSAGPVDFSPDRKWMAYVSYPDMTLWRSRLDGSDKMQLTFSPVRAYEPRWSPDGSQIAFMDVQFSRPWKIRMLSSSGGGSPELLVPGGADEAEADATWMPNGESIVFSKSQGADGVATAVYRLDLKTRKVSSILDSDGLFSPRLSPDGRYISALTSDQTKLMLFDANSNRWSRLMEGEQIAYNEWSHDGKYVYIRQDRGGAAELARVRIKDRVQEHLLSLKDFPQLADMFAVWIGLTPDDEPLLMRDRSLQEIYALDLRLH